MKSKDILVLIVINQLLVMCAECQSATLIDYGYGSDDITSDFGPRNLSGHFWHNGIDYSSIKWTPVNPVETGTINKIAYSAVDNVGYHVNIQGSKGEWGYLHGFEDVANSWPYRTIHGLWEIGVRLTETADTWVIIKWIDPDPEVRKAEFIYSKDEGEEIYLDYAREKIVYDVDGDPLETTATISDVNSPFFLSGDSGNVPEHLHIQLEQGGNKVGENPLLHIKHEPDGILSASMGPETPGSLCAAQLDYPVTISATVDSTNGLDLEKVEFKVYKNKYPSQVIEIGGEAVFDFKGTTNSTPEPHVSELRTDTQSRVVPISNGHDKFYYIGTLSALSSLPAGEHSFAVTVVDVNGEHFGGATKTFTLVKPYITSLRIFDNNYSPSRLKYHKYWDGSAYIFDTDTNGVDINSHISGITAGSTGEAPTVKVQFSGPLPASAVVRLKMIKAVHRS